MRIAVREKLMAHCRIRTLPVLGALGAVLLSTSTILAQEGTGTARDPLIDEIATAWHARQARFQRGVIEWEETEREQSPNDVHHRTGLFAFEGPDSARKETRGPEMDFDYGRMMDMINIQSIVHGKYKCLIDWPARERPPVGIDLPGTQDHEIYGMGFSGVVLTFRPFAAKITHTLAAIDLEQMHVARASAQVAGRNCVVLSGPTPGEFYYLDRERDFVCIRNELHLKEKLLCRSTIQYEDSPPYGPLPVSWTDVEMLQDGTTVRTAREHTVTSVRLNDGTAEPEIEITFPPGTVVHEGERRKYVVREDGSRRYIEEADRQGGQFKPRSNSPEDRDAALAGYYRSLMESEAPSVRAAKLHTWMMIATAVCILGAVLAVRWRLRKASA